MNLLRLSAILTACFVFVALAATASADEKAVDKDKIIGTWKIVKSNGKATSEYGVLEFTKDGKLKITTKAKVVAKGNNGVVSKGKENETVDHTMEVSYEVKGNKLILTAKLGDKEEKRTVTIKTLTDKKLVTVDDKGKEDEFEKTK